ncbi:MAG: sensor histidine kinase [Oscillospiraceae bacterium]|nr:sensor histidine kinase [Oscillospiraceae bacterium]
MFPLSSDILTLADEGAALLQNRRLVFANDAARRILGEDCLGKDLRSLFGSEVAEAQAASFLASVPIGGQNRLLRFSRRDDMQVVFFSLPDTGEALLSEGCLQAMRTGLMNLSLAVGSGRRLAGELGSEALDACFGSLNREYFRLNRLLSNLSTARSIFDGDLPMTPCTTDLGALVSDLADSLGLLRPDVAISCSAGRRVLLWADPQLLELALLNLLSNCLCHAKGLTQIRIELQGLRDRVYLTVRDDGCGIPGDKLCSVFHRYRAPQGLSDLSAGAGLGLTVVRGITEAHGGALMLESREGAGTMVRLSLARSSGGGQPLAEDCVPYAGRMETLLTGLADCLDERCFRGQYAD